jgi:hypothetical protein
MAKVRPRGAMSHGPAHHDGGSLAGKDSLFDSSTGSRTGSGSAGLLIGRPSASSSLIATVGRGRGAPSGFMSHTMARRSASRPGFVRDAPRGGLDSRLPRRCRPTGSRRPRAAAAARAGVAGPERRHVSQTGADAASHRRRIRPAPVRSWTASWSWHRVHLGGGRRRPSVGGVGASMP